MRPRYGTGKTLAPSTLTRPWRAITLAYCAYVALFVAGGLMRRPQLFNSIGAAGMVVLLGALYGNRLLRLRRSPAAIASLLLLLTPLVPWATGSQLIRPGFLIKHYALYVVVLLGLGLKPAPLFCSRTRPWLAGAILVALGLSAMFAPTEITGLVRAKGLFACPNGLALMALSLLMLINESRDSRAFKIAVHSVVGGLILLSYTSGAALGYGVSLVFKIWHGSRLRTRIFLVTATIVVSMLLSVSLEREDVSSVPLFGRLVSQFEMAIAGLPDALSGSHINYYEDSKEYGAGSASGLWRIAHWRRLFDIVVRGTPLQTFFGFGIGSSTALATKMPHNDYMRFLVEQGVIGLLLAMIVWGSLFARAMPATRYVMVAVAVYTFTENNVDNFLFMSLFALFVTSTQLRPVRTIPVAEPAPAPPPPPQEATSP